MIDPGFKDLISKASHLSHCLQRNSIFAAKVRGTEVEYKPEKFSDTRTMCMQFLNSLHAFNRVRYGFCFRIFNDLPCMANRQSHIPVAVTF